MAADYTAQGDVVSTGAVDLYQAPIPAGTTKALLLCPDIFGWNGGRIRAIADSFALQGNYMP